MDYKKVAYYIAKYNYAGIPNEFEVDSKISKEGNLDDFKQLIKTFRGIVYKPPFKSIDSSKNNLDIHNLLKNKTLTQFRAEVNQILKTN